MQIWLILGRSKKCLHIFPLSCLGGGILHAVVSFHLAQLVILLLSALCIREKIFHCGFVNCVKSQRSVNSNLPLKRRIPPAPVQDHCKAQKSISAFGVTERAARGLAICLCELFMYDCLLHELQLSHSAPQALPLLGYISPLNLSVSLPPSSVNPCCCSGCAIWLCYLPRRPHLLAPLFPMHLGPCPTLPPRMDKTSLSSSLKHYLTFSQIPF